jgi:hypothetical protein
MKTFKKDILIKGVPKEVDCLEIDGQTFMVYRGMTRVACLEDEWFDDVTDPKSIISALKTPPFRVDIFTFWQRFPHIAPRFAYYHEFEPVGVLPVQTYDHWFKNVLNSKTRNMIRKSEKLGVQVIEAQFDDQFIRGVTEIFNETPVRQGRPFWHYGKSFGIVKQQFSRYLFREHLIGAYLGSEMIGFMMLPHTKDYMLTGQILSKINHRDKAPNNALIAMAVKLCEKHKIPHLIYPNWGTGSFADFKRHCGFVRTLIPRYFVPITRRGQLALRMGLHRGLKDALPEMVKEKLKALRRAYLERRASA